MNLWQRMESVSGARLGRRLGVLPFEESDRPRSDRQELTVRWVIDETRLRTRETRENNVDDGETSGQPVARLVAQSGQFEADEEPAATRAVLESRIVGLALSEQLEETTEPPGPALLERLPFPTPAPVFAEQLAVLSRRSAGRESVDWAIERVVAELYELNLQEVVDLQGRIRAEG